MNKAKIMIVEDEVIVGKELKVSVEAMGYTVNAVVKTGEDAVEKAVQDRPNLILMDIQLKGQLDGIKAAKIIRSSVDIPVVFLTAHADKEKIRRAKLTMPFGYIIKPFHEKDLKITIEMALYAGKINAKRRQAEEALQKAHDKLEKLMENRTAQLASANKLLRQEIDIRKQAEKSLKESEERFHFLADASMEAIFFTKDGFCLEANHVAAEMFGYDDPSKFIGRFGTEIIAPESHDIVKAHMLKNVFGTYEAIGMRKDGTRFPIVIRAKEMPYKNKEIIRVTSILDITERKLAEEEVKRISIENDLILNTSPGMIFWIDKKGNFIRVNKAFAKALHKSQDDIIGRSLFELYPEAMAKGFFEDNSEVIESGIPKLSPEFCT